nr:protein N terminal asparagine [Hymenolepis microstoma]
MVLFVGGKQFHFSGKNDSESNFEKVIYKELASHNTEPKNNLGDLEEVQISSSGEILYVHRNEMAVAKCNSGDVEDTLPRYAGTSEMTFQLIVILTTPRGFSIGHFDRSDHEWIKDFFKSSLATLSKRNGDECIDVHMVGGFNDDMGLSEELTRRILSHLMGSNLTFLLKTYFCLDMNDQVIGDKIHTPVHRAVVLDIKSHSVKPASIAPSAWGPLLVLRNASLYAFPKVPRMNNILDPLSHRLCFKPFMIHWKKMIELSQLASKPETELTQYSKTSLQESDHFYNLLRRTSGLVGYMLVSGNDFFEGRNLELSLDATRKQWIPLNPQTESAMRHQLALNY